MFEDTLNILENQSAEIKYNLLKMNEKIIEHVSMNYLKKEINQNVKKKSTCKKCQMPCGLNREICYFCDLKKELNLF